MSTERQRDRFYKCAICGEPEGFHSAECAYTLIREVSEPRKASVSMNWFDYLSGALCALGTAAVYSAFVVGWPLLRPARFVVKKWSTRSNADSNRVGRP